ncbi:MAG TPA: FAD-dependent oxidoreductase [Aromatoleum sp.]|uniref:GcvT family protein n=1 Tax=Aromatoleum sp. TaxID=2307007 RepID=UPI002B462A8A|nr:FAD-dependent oxidoreductase [Aromatoleum sp.]HJV26829.1 FAD-dependent oxidoreductase [Aromatoleum sp.]
MKSHARVVVIGGGVVGVSTLYHLTKKGWSDVVLLERTELTAGSTWHAAGLLPLFNMSYTVGQIHKYSVDLYKRLPEETGQEVSFHVTGNLRLATNRDRMDEYLKYCGTANTIGVPFEVISPSQIKELWPLIDLGDGVNTDKVIGALYHPDDGHIAPVDLTMALRKGARMGGAEIYEQTEVTGVQQLPSGEWKITTNKGEITCEHVVCATGNYARQMGRMFGINVPAIPVEHQYIVYDESPELKAYREAGGNELAVLRESDAQYYLREERNGWILGPYEKGAPARFADGVPGWFGKSLFEGDLDRLLPHVEAAMKRVPALETCGIKTIVNGPISYTPDGNPLIGPAFGKRNLWLNEGHSFGVTAAGGSGWQLAEWIVEGEPGIDMLAVDPRRYGAYTSKRYTVAKNEETYRNVFTVHFPDEEREDGRPLKTSPVYDKLDRMGAVWGQRYGWERANWYAPEGVERHDKWSFRRTNYFEHVGNECRLMRDKVGIIDLTAFTKHEVCGAGAEAWLDSLVANKVPSKIGRIALCHALTKRGGIHAEFTITKIADNHYYVVSAGAAERIDSDFLQKNLPADGSVTLRNITGSRGCFVLAGPNSRDVLKKLTDSPLDNKSFPWLTSQVIEVGMATDVYALRVNFVGELGWELHFPIEYAHHIFDQLFAAGREFGIGMVGIRAMESLRVEKSYRMWGTDLTRDNTPFEASLDRFVRMDKGDFIGRAALEQQLAAGVPNRFVTLEVQGVVDADPLGNEPLFNAKGAVVGRATAGYYGHVTGKSIALAYVKPEYAEVGTQLEIQILGERKRAVVVPESPYDPENRKLRADAAA